MGDKQRADHLIKAFENAGQGQVFQFFETLSDADQERLLAQAESIDLSEIAALVEAHVTHSHTGEVDLEGLEPAPFIALPENSACDATHIWENARLKGAEAISAGRVAAFCVAGGQGTRLGFDGPKGTYPVTPVTQKTLFQVFAEKIARSSERFGAPIHWFILTSEINNFATVEAFKAANYFGLSKEQVHFIIQGLVPAVDLNGKILLSEKGKIAMTPDGHGGSLRALVRSGAVETMRKLGIDTVSYFQVDNPIVQCIDPAFVGFHLLGNSELSSKMVPKAYPLEKVGHFCVQNGRNVVIEYSDMPNDMQEATTPDGTLRFRAGSVAIHMFDREFIARAGGDSAENALPFHRANKKIPYLNADGELVKPEAPNGVKFEMFVFDALPMAKNPVIIEASRSEDFSPVKNADGLDSPQSSADDQVRMFTAWLKAADVKIETDSSGLPPFKFEISPHFAVDRADFLAQWEALEQKPAIAEGTVLG